MLIVSIKGKKYKQATTGAFSQRVYSPGNRNELDMSLRIKNTLDYVNK